MLQTAIALLPVAAIGGWYFGKQGKNPQFNDPIKALSRDYLVGLNYLLNEQPDKAVDVFIKMLEVDSETVETHLALGNLFRRRGEVDRAIRIHQNLIARPNLAKAQRIQAMLALGRDYMLAGVLDRAERLFLEVIDAGEYITDSLRYLLDIYEQEKDWPKCIDAAQKIEITTLDSMQQQIAQYYCELAQEARAKVSRDQGYRYLKRALATDKQCVRAVLLYGAWEMEAENYKSAIRAYKRVREQDPDYLSEAINPLVECYQKQASESELLHYLRHCLEEHPRISIVLTLSERLQHWRGEQAAADFIAAQLQERPSLRGLNRLIDLQIGLADGSAKEKLLLLKNLTTQLLQDKPIYRCGHCGYAGKVLHWQCPSCKLWNEVKPIHGLEGD